MFILSKEFTDINKCIKWAKSKNATTVFIENIERYYSYCEKTNVNPNIAIAQYAKETGYGKYGGQVKPEQRNTCGIKNDSGSFASFETWRAGVHAHIDHLALYAGAENFPKEITYDPKHSKSLYGTAKTLEEMSAMWLNGNNDTNGPGVKSYIDFIKKAITDMGASIVNDEPIVNNEANNMDIKKTIEEILLNMGIKKEDIQSDIQDKIETMIPVETDFVMITKEECEMSTVKGDLILKIPKDKKIFSTSVISNLHQVEYKGIIGYVDGKSLEKYEENIPKEYLLTVKTLNEKQVDQIREFLNSLNIEFEVFNRNI